MEDTTGNSPTGKGLRKPSAKKRDGKFPKPQKSQPKLRPEDPASVEAFLRVVIARTMTPRIGLDQAYSGTTARIRRVIYRVGREVTHKGASDRLRLYVGERLQVPVRRTASVYTNLFQLIGSALPQEGFKEAQRRKMAAAMKAAEAWDVHHTFLDHFVAMMGGWSRLRWSDVETGKPPRWVEHLTAKVLTANKVGDGSSHVNPDTRGA